MDFIFCSQTGLVRDHNEDSYLAEQREEYSLFFVADGMGGHKAGEVASRLAIDTLRHFPFRLKRDLLSQVEQAIMAAHREICQNQAMTEKYEGMGTTLSGGILVNNQFFWGHVGDSRIYYYNYEGLSQLTADHSYVQRLINENKISPEEARNHPQKNLLLQALGGSPSIKADTGQLELYPGDLLFLCTDGVNNMVNDFFLEELLKEKLSLAEKSDKLRQEIIKQGAVDNFTFIMVAL